VAIGHSVKSLDETSFHETGAMEDYSEGSPDRSGTYAFLHGSRTAKPLNLLALRAVRGLPFTVNGNHSNLEALADSVA